MSGRLRSEISAGLVEECASCSGGVLVQNLVFKISFFLDICKSVSLHYGSKN